jgi:hypothetical protein
MKRARRPSGLVAAVAAAAIGVAEAAVGVEIEVEIEAGTVAVEEIAEIAATAGNFSARRFFILKLALLEGARLVVKYAPQLSGAPIAIPSKPEQIIHSPANFLSPTQHDYVYYPARINRSFSKLFFPPLRPSSV